ncbi:MAG: GNAT family N-acetyltransferase [Methylobacter sp.]
MGKTITAPFLKNGLSICNNTKIWDDFCFDSPEGTPFMQSWFTDATTKSVDRYFWQENGKPLAAILVPLENGEPSQPKFTVHQSICFSSDLGDLEDAEKTRKCYEILNSIVEQITTKYNKLCFSFNTNIIDVRPFLWHNYHHPEKGTFKIDIRYTAVRSLIDVLSIDNLLQNMRKDRRADYRKSIKENVKITNEINVEEFLRLYEMTFDRQGIEIDNETLSIVRKVLEGISSERGFVLIAKTESHIPISATAILTGKKCAYSLFTVNNPEYRKLGANTSLVIEAMLYAKSIGKSEFDFVGANSPNRGDYKISFNSELKLYFEAKLTSLHSDTVNSARNN